MLTIASVQETNVFNDACEGKVPRLGLGRDLASAQQHVIDGSCLTSSCSETHRSSEVQAQRCSPWYVVCALDDIV